MLQRRSSEYWMPCMLFAAVMLFAAGMPLVSGGRERDGSPIEGAGGGLYIGGCGCMAVAVFGRACSR